MLLEKKGRKMQFIGMPFIANPKYLDMHSYDLMKYILKNIWINLKKKMFIYSKGLKNKVHPYAPSLCFFSGLPGGVRFFWQKKNWI